MGSGKQFGYSLEAIPSYGDLMTLEDFKDNCNSGGFIDYDGYGHYATATQMSNLIVRPSDVKKKKLREDFTHVVWFNR